MSRRSPQFWTNVGRTGFLCLVLAAIALIVAVWLMSETQTGDQPVGFKLAMSLFGVFACLGLVATVAADQSARVAFATQLLSLATGREVEVAVYRHPHSTNPYSTNPVAVFIDGERVEVARMHEIIPPEPGAYTPREWREMAADAVAEPGASYAWVKQVRGWYGEAEAALHEEPPTGIT